MDYSWMNAALAWIGPVAAQVNNFFVYPNKLLAFSGVTVAEYDTPFQLTNEPFGVSYQPAKVINWSRVTDASKDAHAWNLKMNGGKVKLPVIDHFYDPEPITLDGQRVSANDIVTAVRAVVDAVEKNGVGQWANNVHFDDDVVVGNQGDGSVMHHVTLPFSLEKQAELSLDSAKMLLGVSLGPDAEAVFGGELDIKVTKPVDGVPTEVVYGVSYRYLSVVSGPGRFMTVLAQSKPASIAQFARPFFDGVTHYMEIDGELASVFKVLKSLGQDKVDALLEFRPDGLFVSGVGMDAVQVPVQYANNESPSDSTLLQIGLVEINPKKTMNCGFSGSLKPFVIFLEGKTVFIMPKHKGKKQ